MKPILLSLGAQFTLVAGELASDTYADFCLITRNRREVVVFLSEHGLVLTGDQQRRLASFPFTPSLDEHRPESYRVPMGLASLVAKLTRNSQKFIEKYPVEPSVIIAGTTMPDPILLTIVSESQIGAADAVIMIYLDTAGKAAAQVAHTQAQLTESLEELREHLKSSRAARALEQRCKTLPVTSSQSRYHFTDELAGYLYLGEIIRRAAEAKHQPQPPVVYHKPLRAREHLGRRRGTAS